MTSAATHPPVAAHPRASGPLGPWSFPLLLTAGMVALPLAFIVAGLVAAPGEGWVLTPAATLAGYVVSSLTLIVGVATVTLVVGVATGWWIAACDFPGRRAWAWLLVLPLALPAYVAAFGYGDLLDRAIPLVVWVREHAGVEASRAFHTVLRYGAAIAVLASVLYPYVYLAARAAFSVQGRTALEAARMLGCGPAAAFFRVSLPIARPAIVGAVLLVGMEVLNDYGTVSYFGIPTLTVGIFRFWFSFGDPDAAGRIAACTLLVIFALLGLERWTRGRQRFTEAGGRTTPPARYRLRGPAAALAIVGCALPVLIGFALPLARLVHWSWLAGRAAWEGDFITHLLTSLGLAVGTTALILVTALLVGYGERLHPHRGLRWSARLAMLGYAIPSAVLALGVLRGLGVLDSSMLALGVGSGGMAGFLLGGTVAALVFAYLIRFLAVAAVPVQSGLRQVCGDLDAASRCLGTGPGGTLLRINLPLLRPALWSAGILVFVDLLKELPLTLLLRPFNFETLGTRAYNLVDQGRLQEAAPSCLLLIGAGLAGVVILNRLIEREAP